jgi:hypothetical protein
MELVWFTFGGMVGCILGFLTCLDLFVHRSKVITRPEPTTNPPTERNRNV